jgi:hypothetical protein
MAAGVTWITNQQMVAARPAGFGEDEAGECRERTMLSRRSHSITRTCGVRWFADYPATEPIICYFAFTQPIGACRFSSADIKIGNHFKIDDHPRPRSKNGGKQKGCRGRFPRQP